MKHNKAFSLIELAIVGLIISILIAGIIQGSTLISKSKLANARSLTLNSPVVTIDGLVAWYETTLEKSFNPDEAHNDSSISKWYDLNPHVETVRNNASQTTQTNRPLYRTTTINDLPVVEFTRNNSHYLEFDGSKLENSEFTLFFVEQRTSNDSYNYFLGGAHTTLNTNLIVGYDDDTTITIALSDNAMRNTSFTPFSSPTANIITCTFNYINKKLYHNGTNISLTHYANGAQEDATTTYNNAHLGHYNGNYYQGNLGEVILFNKFLNTEDRKSVEHYLGKKWGIDVE